jgi:hypothetical protein
LSYFIGNVQQLWKVCSLVWHRVQASPTARACAVRRSSCRSPSDLCCIVWAAVRSSEFRTKSGTILPTTGPWFESRNNAFISSLRKCDSRNCEGSRSSSPMFGSLPLFCYVVACPPTPLSEVNGLWSKWKLVAPSKWTRLVSSGFIANPDPLFSSWWNNPFAVPPSTSWGFAGGFGELLPPSDRCCRFYIVSWFVTPIEFILPSTIAPISCFYGEPIRGYTVLNVSLLLTITFWLFPWSICFCKLLVTTLDTSAYYHIIKISISWDSCLSTVIKTFPLQVRLLSVSKTSLDYQYLQNEKV